MDNCKIVILALECEATNILIHSLENKISIDSIVFENAVSKKKLVKGRAKKIGWLKTIGQILFILSIDKLLKKISKKRIAEIVNTNKLDASAIDKSNIKFVDSINADTTIEYLKQLEPDLVILSGTRIASKKLLSSINAKFINIHAGITPLYRGVHGGYWALVEGNKNLCGVTLHYVDKGIDTGDIIEQSLIAPSLKDNFATYPYLQMVAGINLLHKNLPALIAKNKINGTALTKESKLWYHPTLIEYLKFRSSKKVK